MIIKFILAMGILAFCALAISIRLNSRLLTLLIIGIGASGVFFVWHPEYTNVMANVIGVGRGADLVFYCFIIIAIISILNQQVQVRALQGTVTGLARHIALAEAAARFPAPERSSEDMPRKS